MKKVIKEIFDFSKGIIIGLILCIVVYCVVMAFLLSYL